MPILARTEQLSRIRVGLPRSIATNRAWTLASTPVSAHRARERRRVEPLACPALARKLRLGVPSRRNRHNVAARALSRCAGDLGRPPAANNKTARFRYPGQRRLTRSQARAIRPATQREETVA